ncbi:hypothetical protein SAMD00079811_83330 (plasmid) [Scytonema sp. HK-05]|uniref:hypothetical protein n=1 Tax=Scytonema sp. HK-05 TaxID=1137095 RepID=UPI0009378160|nr:hypothetical protein [Scytonema sp. HK-05]OKH42760.1 hypothetical protein NIES2130_39535 [Scytonema sp. HK-05]BAY50702.1 hypothetical protein SAMD00079811_83330 [Scytonema sp. HK-05]
MPRGGAREGAGRKPKYGEPTKLRRVPASFTADDVTKAIQSREIITQLQTLIQEWQQQAQEAAEGSKTNKHPRTYDKALKLLEELTQLLPHPDP